MNALAEKTGAVLASTFGADAGESEKVHVIPPKRTRYLSEIADGIACLQRLDGCPSSAWRANCRPCASHALNWPIRDADTPWPAKAEGLTRELDPKNLHWLETWPEEADRYQQDEYIFEVRGKEIRIPTTTKSLSHQDIPKVSVPRLTGWRDLLRWGLQENCARRFSLYSGYLSLQAPRRRPHPHVCRRRRAGATNRRFHYVSGDMPAKRLSTAFDSVTLYGRDPDLRPDIHGKVGNSGVSVCSLDDAKSACTAVLTSATPLPVCR